MHVGFDCQRAMRIPTSEDERLNYVMSKYRISVEWAFGAANQKCGMIFIVAGLLQNCKTILHGGEALNFFDGSFERLQSVLPVSIEG